MIGIGVIDYLTFAAGGTQWSVLFGMKKLNFLVISMLPTALLNFGLSVYFVGYTDLGVFGVILATIVISICRRPILIWYTARLVGIRPVTYFLQSYLVPVSLLAAVSLVGHGMIRLWNPVTWTSLIVSAAILTLIWLGLVFQFGVTREERKKVSNWISRVLERFRKHAA
jgi:O-antigen/teichoic acid export membrane protein